MPVRQGFGSKVVDLDRGRGLHHRGCGLAPHGAVDLQTPLLSNPFDDPQAGAVQRWAGLVHYAVRLAGRRDDLIAVREQLGGRDLWCGCGLDDVACHRRVLLDYAHAPLDPVAAGGHAMGLTLRRPWASMLMVPGQAGGKTVETLTFSTDYRGPVLIYSGSQLDQSGVTLGARLGLQCMQFHAEQKGWLGATVLTDVHRARRCCAPWGKSPRRDQPGKHTKPLYHWVFEFPARLAARPWHKHAKGFLSLQPVSWSALVNPKALSHNTVRRRS
ncbi:MAG: DUF4326 domain-containing protein [Actinomycetia bacterium]|nr:DUF4326 domain-containing protein [Actinomycetes bacterium]